jgi:acyl dehydratase
MPNAVAGPYNLEAARAEWIGKKTTRTAGRYPVEYDPIRRHCHMVEDTNPLFLDPSSSEAAAHGGVIAPPVLAGYFAGNGIWPKSEAENALADIPTRGERFINMNVSWEYFAPVRIGDQLSSETVLVDLFEKSIKLDPKAVWVVTERRIYNQNDELVATNTNTLLTHRRPEVVAADAEGN